jgi:hemin uptake protein HemP
LKSSKEAETSPPGDGQSRMIAIAGNRIVSGDLFVGTKEITIGHGTEVYRLRLTAQNKLILTK